ncbi:MAG: glutathione S-transferase family protein [Anaerolineae bacterium]
MTQLLEQDIQTKEVLDWKGVHLFHFSSSSCSQKTRIFLNLKGIEWESHVINLPQGEQLTPWFLGINPRGLVPVLVLDGAVHIESNDIIQLLDQTFPQNKLIPAGYEDKMSQLLHHEDDLHLDIRSISFRFTQKRGKAPKSAEDIKNYRELGSGTVEGNPDPKKEREAKYWENYAKNEGVTDEAIKISAERFRSTLAELEANMGDNLFLLGDSLTLLDIAWFVYVNRLMICGYPLERLHPKLHRWFIPLTQRPEFANEVVTPPHIQAAIDENHRNQAAAGATLVDVAGI